MANHEANRKSSGRRGATSSAGQQQKHSRKHSKRADLAGKVVKPSNKAWDVRDQLEKAWLAKIPRLPTEVGFFMTMPAANNGPVRIHYQNLTKRQTIAMVKALNRTLPFPQWRLTKWCEKVAKEAKAGGKQRKVQQQQQQRQQKKARMPLLHRDSSRAQVGWAFSPLLALTPFE
jgi:hypothetical protein